MRLILTIFTLIASFAVNGQTLFGSLNILHENELEQPEYIQAGDLNGDSIPDLLLLSPRDKKAVWYPGIGDGTYGDQILLLDDLSDQYSNNRPVIMDFDGDGDNDIMVAGSQGTNYVVEFLFENQGCGVFADPVDLAEETGISISVSAWGDMDGDGDLDIVGWGGSPISLILSVNNGDYTFTTYGMAYSAAEIYNVELADLDGDGDLDILVNAWNSESSPNTRVDWIRNDGPNEYYTENIHNIYSDTLWPDKSYAFADMDDDGDLDIFEAAYYYSYPKGELAWMENDSGTFTREILYVQSGNWQPTISDWGDVDGDGRTDFIVDTYLGNRSIRRNNGDGTISNLSGLSSTPGFIQTVWLTDLDEDGDLDAAEMDPESQHVYCSYNNGSGNFDPDDGVIRSPGLISGVAFTAFDDLDNDGDADLITWSVNDNKLVYHRNDGSQGFADKVFIALNNEDSDIWHLELSDLDSDGDKDIFCVYNKRVAWYENLGGTGFGELVTIDDTHFAYRAGGTGDLDGDGDIDVVSGYNDLYWYENTGGGNFGARQDLHDFSGILRELRIGDIDGDGDRDIVTLHSSSSKVALLSNDGAGGFSGESVLAEGFPSSTILQVIDLEGDGDRDIVIASTNNRDISYIENSGSGSFEPLAEAIDPSYFFDDVHLDDLDNDGDADMLVAFRSNFDVFAFLNDGSNNFDIQFRAANYSGGDRRINTADLDADGDNDLITHELGDGYVHWFQNRLEEALTIVYGQAYWDANGDSVYNDGELPIPGMPVYLDMDSGTAYTDFNGFYSIGTAAAGAHTITLDTPAFWSCEGFRDYVLEAPVPYPFTFSFVPGLNVEQDLVFSRPALDCRTVSGTVFEDLDGNGIQDGGEPGLSNILVYSNGFGTVRTAFDGTFSLDVAANEEIVISADLIDRQLSPTCPVNTVQYTQVAPAGGAGQSVAAGTGDVTGLDFAVSVERSFAIDLGIRELVVTNGDEAGEVFRTWMDFSAAGEFMQPCSLRLVHSDLLTLQDSDIPFAASTPTSKTWVFPPGSVPSFYCMAMDWVLDSSAVNGNVLRWEGFYDSPPQSDTCPANNSIIREVEIIDGPLRLENLPAAMHSMRPEGVMPEEVPADAQLSFVIDFANPLPAVAGSLIIIDTLPAALDPRTVTRPITSVPYYTYSVSEEGILTVVMDAAGLTAAGENELNSYGFLQFGARLAEDIEPGAVFANRATVIFNGLRNETTNTVVHRVAGVSTGVEDALAGNAVTVYPNPTSGWSYIRFVTEPAFLYEVNLLDILGKTVRSFEGLNGNPAVIGTYGIPSGLYYLTIHPEGSERILQTFKLVIQ